MLQRIKASLKKYLRGRGNPLLPRRTLEHLEALRVQELASVIRHLPVGGRLLEIGAGTGWQARFLARRGFDVAAIDVAASNYSDQRVWPVVDYDGQRIPFPDRSFDVVFSSNTLEHIPHIEAFQDEIHRVLKSDGVAVHVVPSASWRFWTNLTHPIRYLTPAFVHGEHSANTLTEMAHFSRWRWTRLFQRTRWEIRTRDVNGLFYTGCSVADRYLSIPARMRLSKVLGSSCHVYVLTSKAQLVTKALVARTG